MAAQCFEARPKKVLTANIRVHFDFAPQPWIQVCTTDLTAAVLDESTFPMGALTESLKSKLEATLEAKVVAFFSDDGLEVAVTGDLAQHRRLTIQTQEDYFGWRFDEGNLIPPVQGQEQISTILNLLADSDCVCSSPVAASLQGLSKQRNSG